MAGEVDDIVQNIVLTGNEEVAGAFERIQEAGERAFDAIKESMEHLGSVEGITTAIAGIAAAFAIAGVGAFEFTREMAESVSSLSDLADKLGTTIEDMSGLKAAFAAGGVGAGEMESAFRHLAVVSQATWNEIKQQSREASSQMVNDAINTAKAAQSVEKAERDVANTQRDQQLQRSGDLNSVADAQQRLDELHAKALKEAGVDTTQLDQQLAKQREFNELKSAELALANAKKKAADDEANREDEALTRELAHRKAVQDFADVQRKEDDDRKNNINNVIDAVQQLANGNKDALSGINASTENLKKGIVGAAGESEKALGNLKGDISDLASSGPEGIDVFEKLAAVMGSLDNEAQKGALATAFFGRSVSQSMINVISSSEKLEEFRKRIHDLGLDEGLDAARKASDAFRESLFTLENDISLVAQRLVAVFGPGFKQVLDALDQALIANKQNIINFAQEIVNKALPAIESFIRVLSGAAQPQDQWLVDLIDKFKRFGNGLLEVATIVGKAIGFIIDSFDDVANQINDVFGTKLNGVTLFFAAFVASILAQSKVLMFTMQAVAAGIVEAMALAGPEILLVAAAVYTLVQAWSALSDAINVEGHADAWAKIFDGVLLKLKAIAEFITGDFKKAAEDWHQAVKQQADAWKELDEANGKSVKSAADNLKELTDTAKKQAEEQADKVKKSYEDQTKASKDAADSQVNDQHRLRNESDQTNQKMKRDAQDIAKQQQTHPNLTFGQGASIQGSQGGGQAFTDKNGVTNIPWGASQDSINKAIGNQLAEHGPGGVANIPFGSDQKQQDKILKAAEDFRKAVEKLQEEAKKLPVPKPDPRKAQDDVDTIKKGVEEANKDQPKLPQEAGKLQPPPPELPPPLRFDGIPPGALDGFGADGVPALKDVEQFIDKLKSIPPGTLDGLGAEGVPPIKDTADSLLQGLKGAFEEFENSLKKPTPEDLNKPPNPNDSLPQGDFPPTNRELFPPEGIDRRRVEDNTAPALQKVADNGDRAGGVLGSLADVVQTLISKINNAADKPDERKLDRPTGGGLRGEADQVDTQPIQTAFEQVGQAVQTGGEQAGQGIAAGGQQVADALAQAAAAIAAAAAGLGGGGGGGTVDAAVEAASGGHIWGPGTETSDSIPAWLSRNEFVQPAYAVRHYGVEFMENIRHLRMPKFNAGGLVGLLNPSLPRFSGGGHVMAPSVSRLPHLGSVDLRTDHGPVRVVAGPSAISQLQRAASTKRITSSSKRKPEFVG